MVNRDRTVLVVDDDPSVRSSLQRLLETEGYAVCTYSDAGQLLARGRPEGPSCLILDVRLAGSNGIDVHETLVRAGIQIATIFITGFADIPMTVRAMKQGAIDVLSKPYAPDQLLTCVRAALDKDLAALASRRRLQVICERYASLTPREQEIFVDVASGMLNKQIAYEYDISEKTVKVHRARVMEKMEAEALADLVRMADLLHLPCARPATSEDRPSHTRTAVAR
jgi:FixJ family two-component response regulator